MDKMFACLLGYVHPPVLGADIIGCRTRRWTFAMPNICASKAATRCTSAHNGYAACEMGRKISTTKVNVLILHELGRETKSGCEERWRFGALGGRGLLFIVCFFVEKNGDWQPERVGLDLGAQGMRSLSWNIHFFLWFLE